MRSAVSVAAAALAALGGLFYFGSVLLVGTPVAFAEVAQKLRDAEGFACKATVQAPDRKEAVVMQFFVKGPGWVRIEGPGGQITIAQPEPKKYRVLTLDPAARTALLLDQKKPDRPQDPPELRVPARGPALPFAQAKQGPGPSDLQLPEKLRRLVEKEAQPVGRKQTDGVQAQGFRVREGQVEWLIWADPKTRLPVRVEVTYPDGGRVTLSDFRFNPALDDALFSLEVPKGYKLLPVEIDSTTPEGALVWLLRSYAEASEGKFPPRLDRADAFDKHPLNVGGDKKKLSPEGLRFGLNLARVLAFVWTLKGSHGYKPDGVKLGDADKVLFWYRPAGAARYRALYGDLHWADVTTDQLPEVPKP
jgi:outer membrane lipoprotein-sorting protein